MRHARLIVVLAGLLTVLAVLRLTSAGWVTDLSTLLPDDDPALAAYLESRQRFAAESVLLFLERLDGEEVEADLADELVALAVAEPSLAGASTLPFAIPSLEELEPHIARLLPAERRAQLLQQLAPQGLEMQARLLRRRLLGPGGVALREVARRDPLGLLELLFAGRQEIGGGQSFAEGAVLSEDRRALLVFVRVSSGAGDEAAWQELLAALARLESRWPARLAELELDPSQYRLRFTGPPVVAAQEAALLQEETRDSLLISLVAVVLLFALAFRRPGAFLWLTLPLVAAVLWTLVAADLLFGGLNVLTAASSVFLVGLGIDFGIHLYSRALDRRAAGLSPAEALVAAGSETAGANLFAALTSVVAFASLVFEPVPGWRQMGMIAAFGLLVAVVMMTAVFPAGLLLVGALGKRQAEVRTLPGRFLGPWLALVERRPRIVLASIGLLTLLAVLALPRLGFGDPDLGERLAVSPALVVQQEVGARFGSSFRASLVLIDAADLDGLRSLVGEVTTAADELASEELVGGVVSPLGWLPSAQEQRKTLTAVAALWPDGVEAMRGSVREALRGAGLDPAAFLPGIDALEGLFAEPVISDALLLEQSVAAIVASAVHETAGGYQTAVYLLPGAESPPGVLAARLTPLLERLRRRGARSAELVTPEVFGQAIERASREGLVKVTSAAALGILVLLVFHLRRPLWILLALTPLAIAVSWTLGLAAVLGVRLSVANIAALPMILGIGIDDALHVLHHLRLHPDRPLRTCLTESGKALVLTTVTTVLAFGSLALAGHPALRSLGILTSCGLLFALLGTLSVVPAIAALSPGMRGTAASE